MSKTQDNTKLLEAGNEARAFIQRFDGAFIERKNVSDCLLLASVAELPIVLLGPPGTAKSLMINTFAKCMGKTFFQYLITKFTTPDELFGQFKISALKKDKLERAWKGTSVDAEAIFWDEVFKGGSALLNAMLTALNEKQADIGTGRVPMQYQLIAGASNELPEQDQGLEALWDRWALRCWVPYIKTDAGFKRLMEDDQIGKFSENFEWGNIQTLRDARDSVDTKGLSQTLLMIRAKLYDIGVTLSERKWLWVKKAIKASAIINGRTTASKGDLKVLSYMAWDSLENLAEVSNVIKEATAGNSIQITKLVSALMVSDWDDRFEFWISHYEDVVSEATKIGEQEGWDDECRVEMQKLLAEAMANLIGVVTTKNREMREYDIGQFGQMADNISKCSQIAQLTKRLIDSSTAATEMFEKDSRLSQDKATLRKCLTENNNLFQSKTNQL